ncbi:UPF0183 protein, partial [Mucuna pruriens]
MAIGTIAFDLCLDIGIRSFSLKIPICETYAQIEQQPNTYNAVHVKYFDEEPLKLDIVISFPNHGFHLHFDMWSQRLRLIEIFDVKRLEMCYSTSLMFSYFCCCICTIWTHILRNFYKDRGIYTLFYLGLSFAFPIPSQFTNCCHDGGVSLPLEFPNGTTVVTCCVSIFDSSSKKVGVGCLMNKAFAPPLPADNIYKKRFNIFLLLLLRKMYGLSVGTHHDFFFSTRK